MKLTDERVETVYNLALAQSLRPQDKAIVFKFARAIEAEVLRLNGITGDGRGEAELYANSEQVKEALAGELGSIDVWPRKAMQAQWGKPGTGFYDTPIYTAPPQQQQASPGAVPDGWISVEQQMPKSGQIVLALQKWDHSGKMGIIRAAWIAAKTEESSPESDIGVYDEEKDCYYDPEGWYEQISHWDEISAAGVSGATIVAWMPLPAAMLSASPAAPEAEKPDNWQQYAQDGENAQQCIERHRKEQDALLELLKKSRRPYSDNEEMKL